VSGEPTLVLVLLAGVLGALAGPVLRARIFRHSVPAEQWVREQCPACDRRLVSSGWRGLLTVLPPTGRCPGCRQRVGPAPGAVEIAGAVSFALLALVGGSPLVAAAFWWVAAAGVALAFVDVAVHRLPDRLTLSAYAGALVLLGAAALVDDRLRGFGLAVLYGLAMAFCYLVLVLAYPSGMGLGDAKLALVLGLALGWFGGVVVVLGAAAGLLLAGLYAVVLLALRRVGRKDAIAHGPAMLLGALAVVLLVGWPVA
jgi:leader peptidase (prepilin peptidase) / N-methyltransferase